MTIKTKPDAPAQHIDVGLHERCVILHVKGKNTLYEFSEGDKLVNDLRMYIDTEDIKRVKTFLQANTRMTFKKNDIEPNQLSLF